MTEQYIELHARSAFSFLEGASLPDRLITAAADAGLPAMALLDRNGVYGAPKFHMAGKRSSVTAHIGAEIALEDGSFCPLLAETRQGYQNLCRLITRIKLAHEVKAPPIGNNAGNNAGSSRGTASTATDGSPESNSLPKSSGRRQRSAKIQGVATYDNLIEFNQGLICLTGGEDGPLAMALSKGKRQATRLLQKLKGIFDEDRLYVELQRHYDRLEECRNQTAMQMARSLGLPILATNGVCYAGPEQRELLDAFTCIKNHVRLATAGRLLARNAERFVKSADEMVRLFWDIPEATANTVELSARLEYTMESLGYEFPHYPVPPGEIEDSYLRKQTMIGARVRYTGEGEIPAFERALLQLEHELRIIEKLKLSGYFLIVWDLINFCRDGKILVQGRGSAANSAVCYSLGITAVDPVGMDLLFERFLSEQRGEWPDIDLDLPSGDQRERVIQYVYSRYGKLGAAMTANVITYRDRSAIREMGRVLGFDEPMLASIARLSGRWEWRDENDLPEQCFKQAGLDLHHPRIHKFLELCAGVQDLPRHLGQHSGGMVICQGHLDKIVPLEPASMPGRVVVQWDKDDCADMGIIKVDLLGLGMMAVLEDSLILIRDHYGEQVDLSQLPKSDPQVYAALQKADTIGLFQVESRAQMSCLPRLKPVRFYDIVVQVALIRPGPIVGDMVHPYLRRREGKEPPVCLHPSLGPVLDRTLGVPLFQEQLLKMAMICAGFSGGEAEELRRAFGFKRPKFKMAEVEVKLRRGMRKNQITGKVQDDLVKAITSFAAYGFPESHAASFALIAYVSAYLKIHYLAAFTAAILNNQPMGFYQPATLVKDAQRHGLRVRPIDVTRSAWLCTIETAGKEHCVRLGLNYVRGLRSQSGMALVAERERDPFTSIDNLIRRVPELNRAELQKLAKVGALNFINAPPEGQSTDRRTALWDVAGASRKIGPLLLQHDGSPIGPAKKPSLKPSLKSRRGPLKPMTEPERLEADMQGTGLTLGPHPLTHFRDNLRRQGVTLAKDLAAIADGARVRVAGIVIVRQRPGSAKGFMFLSLEDETGILNIIVNPGTFEKYKAPLVQNGCLFIDGVSQNQGGVISVKAFKIKPLYLGHPTVASHDFR